MNLRGPLRILTMIVLAAALAACGRNDPESLIASAKSALDKGDAKTAIIQLKNALQQAPDNGEARFLLAKSLLESGDAAAAETEVRKAIDRRYSADEAYPLLGQALLMQGEYRKVATELGNKTFTTPKATAEAGMSVGLARLALGEKKEAREAIAGAMAAMPGDAKVMVAQARVEAADGDAAAAMKQVDAALAAKPDDVNALAFKSELEMAQGRREDGIKTLERVVQLKPDMLAARLGLVAALADAGKADRAAELLEPAKKAAPQDPRVRYAEALVAYARGDMKGAQEAVLAVLGAAPKYLPALYLSGIVNYRLGAYGAAEEALRTVVSNAPDDSGARRMLAATYVRNGRTAQAQQVLEPALAKTPNDPVLLRAAAEVQLASNNPARAAEFYERANELDKNNAAGRIRLAQAQLAAGGNDVAALKDLESIAAANPALPAADLALIAAHLRRRENDQALAAAEAFAKKQPTNPLAYNLEGVVYSAKGDFANARASFERALKQDPAFTSAAYNLAQLDLMQRDTDAARKRYQEILAKDPRNEQALLATASIAAVKRAPAGEVKAAFDRAVDANPGSARARMALITYYAQQRDVKATLAAAQAANAAIPDNPQLLEALAGAQQAAGESNQALETMTRAAKLQPDSPLPLLRIAGVQSSLKDYDGAFASLRKAIALDPGFTAAWIATSNLYVATNRFDAGLAGARRMQKEMPKRAVGFAVEGNLLMAEKKPADAAKAYREALAREATPLVAVSLYGALQTAGKKDEAAAMAQRWEKENPKDVMVRSVLAQQALVSKDYKTAVTYLRAVLDVEPDNVVALNNLAWALNELGDPQAIGYAERAAHLAPFAASVMDTQGWILVAQDKTPRGVDLLRTASQLAPEDADIRLHLAKALLKTGDKAGAKSELEAVAVLTKPSPARAEAQQMLKDL